VNPDTHDQRDSFGLLACGSSGSWSVDLDESSDGTVLSLQLDGPHVYLSCVIRDLGVIRSTVEYLRANRDQGEGSPLGHFGSADVCLHWDNEDFPRCFLIVGPMANSCVRVTLLAEDIAALVASLEQVLEDLTDEPVNPP
jgi:hypothetical protein